MVFFRRRKMELGEQYQIVAVYGTMGRTSTTTTMYRATMDGTLVEPVDVAWPVLFVIFTYNGTSRVYDDYKGTTPVRSGTAEKGDGTGVYVSTYDYLSAGDYVFFALKEL